MTMARASWSVVISGQPAAQGRPRFARGRAYRAGRSVQWEAAASEVMGRSFAASGLASIPEDCAVTIEILALFRRPKRLIWKRRPMPRLPHATKPDLDNVIKSTLDALELSGVVANDKAVHAVTASKWYAAGDEPAALHLRLSWEVEADE